MGGPGLDQTYLLPQMLDLTKSYQLTFYDQRGSGRSLETKINSKYINMLQFTKDLEIVRRKLGYQKFVLMGHSWGSLLAMHYALTHQEYLSGLVLLNTAPVNDKGQKAFIDEFHKRTKSIREEIKPLFKYDEFKKLTPFEITKIYKTLFSCYFYNPKEVKNLTLQFNKISARSGFRVMEEMLKTSWLRPNVNLIPKLRRLRTPTTLIHCYEDIVPYWVAQEIKKAIPNSELILLKKCGHFPYIERKNKFFFSLREFLKKIHY